MGGLACIDLSGALETRVRVGRANPDAAEGDYAGDGWHDQVFGAAKPVDVAELYDGEDHWRC